ncbi:hypothetical protein WMF20_18665 [Sorangium sp. So ce834]|uniref:hypothetical protein n=1 Tax=Sorangium sp. So ce834 TaxID=3133321 RepID=UPI003F63F605
MLPTNLTGSGSPPPPELALLALLALLELLALLALLDDELAPPAPPSPDPEEAEPEPAAPEPPVPEALASVLSEELASSLQPPVTPMPIIAEPTNAAIPIVSETPRKLGKAMWPPLWSVKKDTGLQPPDAQEVE